MPPLAAREASAMGPAKRLPSPLRARRCPRRRWRPPTPPSLHHYRRFRLSCAHECPVPSPHFLLHARGPDIPTCKITTCYLEASCASGVDIFSNILQYVKSINAPELILRSASWILMRFGLSHTAQIRSASPSFFTSHIVQLC